MDSTNVADFGVPCECVFVCICESNNGVQNAPGQNDKFESKMTITNTNEPFKCSSITNNCSSSINNSNLHNGKTSSTTGGLEKPCGTSNSKPSESDPGICCACASKRDKTDKDDSCELDLFSNPKPFPGLNLNSKYFTEHVFGARLHNYFVRIRIEKKNADQNVIMKYYDPTLDIYSKLCSTKQQLKEDDFIEMTNTLKTFKKVGLVTDSIFLDFTKAIKESGYSLSGINDLSCNMSEMNLEDTHQKTDALKYFNSRANKFYGSAYTEMAGDIKALEKREIYPDIIFAKIIEPFEKCDDIKSRENLLISLDFSVVLRDLKMLHEEGWLSQADLSKHNEVDKLGQDFMAERAVIANQMKNPIKRITDQLKIKPNGEIKYDIEYRELPMEDANWELIGLRVCMSKHNTPLCEMCGSQSSWVKTFKKRGINIKEADSSNNKHVWHNNAKDI